MQYKLTRREKRKRDELAVLAVEQPLLSRWRNRRRESALKKLGFTHEEFLENKRWREVHELAIDHGRDSILGLSWKDEDQELKHKVVGVGRVENEVVYRVKNMERYITEKNAPAVDIPENELRKILALVDSLEDFKF